MSVIKREYSRCEADWEGPSPPKKNLLESSEVNIDALRSQHEKLKQRLASSQKHETALRERIEQLEKRQTQDDAVLNVINRYWSQLNEDVRLLLHRFDAEVSESAEDKNETEAATSFLAQLSTWDKEELSDKLAMRVQVSTRAVAKIVQAFDHLQRRNENITQTLQGDGRGIQVASLDNSIKKANVELKAENERIEVLNTSLHGKYQSMPSKIRKLQGEITAKETEGGELQNQVADLKWEVSKMMSQNDKLTNHVQDLNEKYRRLQQLCSSSQSSSSEASEKIMEDMVQRKVAMGEQEVVNLQKDSEELRDLANNRLAELECLHQTQRETFLELEKLRVEVHEIPESTIVNTTEYKSLQSQFSVLYSDNLQMRTALEESRQRLYTMRTDHFKHVEKMQSEELLVQKKLQVESARLQNLLRKTKEDYVMLQGEMEQNGINNHERVIVNADMRHLIRSMLANNRQLRQQTSGYKKKHKELGVQNIQLKQGNDELEEKLYDIMEWGSLDSYADEDNYPTSIRALLKEDSPSENKSDGEPPLVKADIIKQLQAQLKSTLSDQREMKLLLDMYKGASPDQWDKVKLMAAERKTRQELEKVQDALKKLENNQNEELKKLANKDAQRRRKVLDEQLLNMQRSASAQKMEEEALLTEMEVTGTAYEDSLEQNARLIQLLREKDDANFKLLTDQIKSNQLYKMKDEETVVLQGNSATLTKQVEDQIHVVRNLEARERLFLSSIIAMENEAILRNQATEGHKRKAIQGSQAAADLKLHLEKYRVLVHDAQQTVTEKTSALEAEAYKTKRLQEEVATLTKKVERLNKIEMTGNTTEVMMEEIREYKETLTCPSCKVKRKDAVIAKCFHVFCFDCLRTRYETRQRKCPKCNAAFGANDYHRLYLS